MMARLNDLMAQCRLGIRAVREMLGRGAEPIMSILPEEAADVLRRQLLRLETVCERIYADEDEKASEQQRNLQGLTTSVMINNASTVSHGFHERADIWTIAAATFLRSNATTAAKVSSKLIVIE